MAGHQRPDVFLMTAIRRNGAPAAPYLRDEDMRFRWDDFVLDLDAFRLERDGRAVPLEPKAFNLLALVAQRPGHVFSKQELFDTLWPDTAVSDHALTRVVSQIRRGLGDEAREARYLETVPTRGYRWLRQLAPEPAVTAPAPVPAVVPVTPSASPRARPVWPRGVVAAVLVATATAAWLAAWTVGGGARATAITAPAAATSGGAVRDWRPPVQFTTHAGLDLHPALSPLGDALAFASDRSGAFELYVRALGGSAADMALTRDGGQNVQPAWSPDGRWLAYHSSGRGGIWVMAARGGAPRQLVAEGANPAWSPDGRRLVFQSDEFADATPSGYGAQSGSTLWTMAADGSDRQPLTREGQPLGGHALPAWTPDGRFVAFMVFDGGASSGLWLTDASGGEPRPLEIGRGLYEFAFAPDGRAIYAAGGAARLVRVPFDPERGVTTGPRELVPVPGVPGVRGLSVAPDGSALAFSGLSLSSQIWAQPVARDGTPRGDAHAVTTDTSRRNALAAVSPDGTRLAYMSSRQGAPPSVWVMDVNGEHRVPLTPDDSADGEPTWFADGQRVAYWTNREGGESIWVVDAATRRESPWLDLQGIARRAGAVQPAGQLAEMRFAPDMTRAAFSLLAPPLGRRVLYVTAVAPYAPRALTTGAASTGYPAWSPDASSLAVELKDGSSVHAAVIDVASGALRQLTRERGQTWVRSWSPDGHALAAATWRNGVWSLRRIDARTGAETVLTPAVGPRVYLRYPDWSPRGDLVVFERGELQGNVWLLPLR